MELLRISDTKLKVTLTEEDMERYRLDSKTMDYDTTETRSAFWQILDAAKQRTGFDAGGEKLFVQVYPSRGGGCEMYVTLVNDGEDEVAPEPPRRELSVLSIYRFPTLDLLLTACRKLSELGYRRESRAFSVEGEYCLVIGELCEGGLLQYGFLEEYGHRESGGVLLSYLTEHGICLAEERAVERLSVLSNAK